MVEPRIDPDANPADGDVERVATLLAHAMCRLQGITYHERTNGNGGKLLTWLLGMIASLVVLGIGGEVVMYGKMTVLESQVADLRKVVEPRFRGITPEESH